MKTIVELERERRLDPCRNCDTDRSKCEYGCGEENHWAARHSAVEIAAQDQAATDSQQLRSKISALVTEFDATGSQRYSSQNFDRVIELMRQTITVR